ncbi:MAG: RNA polymerase sigma factor RpoE [Gammaproteobacteria bacterium]|nr:RNA polymerase sigma factor RpoE [Gammaproteobacteria bacterium]
MSERESDQLLVEQVLRGDKRAFDALVIRYQSRVVKVISRYVRDSAESLDLAQEAFIKAYRALPDFRGESAFYTWLYRIAINTAKNFLASQGRRPPQEDVAIEDAEYYDGPSELKDTATPEQYMLRDEIERVIFQTIESLPDELRTAITLRELEDMSYEEIAEAMNCPIGTVRSRIFRAREAIDKQLKPLLSGE